MIIQLIFVVTKLFMPRDRTVPWWRPNRGGRTGEGPKWVATIVMTSLSRFQVKPPFKGVYGIQSGYLINMSNKHIKNYHYLEVDF